MQPSFFDVAGRFQKAKYPLDVYDRLVTAFKTPRAVSRGDLRQALLWKYGHQGKGGRIPDVHQAVISDVEGAWPRLASSVPTEPEELFVRLDGMCGGPTRFITVAFLVHLVFPERVPIVDQHNFRAVNSFLHERRPMWVGKERPTKWADVLTVDKFIVGVMSSWPRGSAGTTTPTRQQLDHFLMMYGKSLKKRPNHRLQPSAAGAMMGRRG